MNPSTIAFSITRLVYLVNINTHSRDFTWTLVDDEIWTALEMNIALVSGRYPCVRSSASEANHA